MNGIEQQDPPEAVDEPTDNRGLEEPREGKPSLPQPEQPSHSAAYASAKTTREGRPSLEPSKEDVKATKKVQEEQKGCTGSRV